ncbi:MAG: sulfatase-like hydrolase/transferase [Isosphaeraceae bacterium]|nr:sulfatase-like hydrolase/transferase [Isosphaeraceae bacterium]
MIASYLAMLATLAAPASDVRPPNVVFILADDLGYGDLGCQGHPFARTPEIDRLAAQGTRFERCYSAGITCSPARTGLMTGRFPARFSPRPDRAGFGDRPTVTAALHDAGYATGHFGKWHIGPNTRPGTYGIDRIEEIGGARRDDRGRDAPIFDQAIAFIEQNRNKPFYVNIWGHISHNPVDAPDGFADRFRETRLEPERFPKPMQHKLAERIAEHGFERTEEGLREYLGELAALDAQVGRVLERLEQLGLAENTIVVFSSDQGAVGAGSAGVIGEADGEDDTHPNALGSNGALRGGKHTQFEGGVRVPFLIRWPGRIPAGRVDRGSIIAGVDWFPSVCKVAGIAAPADLDGEDVSDIWLGKERPRSRPLFWKTAAANSRASMLDGRWKFHQQRRGASGTLHDLDIDPLEAIDRADGESELARRLGEAARAWTATLPKPAVEPPPAGDARALERARKRERKKLEKSAPTAPRP